MKKLVLILALVILVGGAAFSFDMTTFPAPLKPGSLLVNVGGTLGSYWFTGMSFGAIGAVDYCMPFPIAITFGGEAGIMLTSGAYYGYSRNMAIIPIMFRAAWHPNFEVPNLDVYGMLKVGYGIGFWTNNNNNSSYSNYSNPGGFIFGAVIGGRYFFSSNMAVYGELGWENYTMNYSYKYSSSSWNDYELVSRFLTAGVSFTF
ncbi:MAG: hypothetical protein FWD78_10960 [Treponema sp.]|nr:hypothetical protein [Treponema sp.]